MNRHGPEVSLSGSNPHKVVSHPANFDPLAAVAVNTTFVVPAANPENEQVPLEAPPVIVQLIPAGLLVIVPLPVPAPATVSVGDGDVEPLVNVATTVVAAVNVIVQRPVPGHVVDEPLTIQLANE